MALTIDEKLNALWARFVKEERNEEFREILERGYCFHEIEQRPILFMGINPSWDEAMEGNFSYNLPKIPGQPEAKYFKHYYDCAEGAGFERSQWTYQDVFFYRHTKQETAPEHTNKNWLKFLVEHLKITQKVIEHTAPKLIVVCNAEASEHYFGVNANEARTEYVFMGYDFEFDKEVGCHKITGCRPALGSDYRVDTQLVGTYVLFTSYLPYRSKPDKETLQWHLRHIWEKKNLY